MKEDVTRRCDGVMPARISRNGCRSFGLGSPKNRSHASEPNPMTHDKPPFEVTKADRPQESGEITTQRPHDGITSRLGLIVTTRKIAARRELRDDRLRNSGWQAWLLVGPICSASVYLTPVERKD